MGKRRRIAFIVLCEDKQQQVFALHFLRNFWGANIRDIRFCDLPDGKGSGEQFVRDSYLQEVRTHRSKSSYISSLRLIVMVDADRLSVEERQRQFDEALEAAGQEKRGDKERIAIFVPKRNIETCIHYLKGATVDEETAYPKFPNQGDCKVEVARLAETICPDAGLSEDAPPSLQAACPELARLGPS